MLKKRNGKSLALMMLAMLMALCMLATGCTGDKEPVSSSVENSESTLPTGDTTTTTPEEGSATTLNGDTTTSTRGGNKTTTTTTGGNKKTTTTKRVSNVKLGGTPDEALKSMPKKLRGTKLVYYYWWDAYTQMDGEAIKAFTKKTGIEVESVVGEYQGFMSELAARITAGNAPDMVRLLSNAMYQVKSLQPITNSGYDFKDAVWWDQLMADYTYNGRTYAVNLRPKNAAILDTYMIYYNTRALKAAKIEDPYQLWKKNPKAWTWKKLWSMCEEYVEYKNNPNFSGIGFGYANAYVRMFGCANYDYNAKTGKWENYMRNTELAKRWTELLTYREKGWATGSGSKLEFGKGQFVFYGYGPYPARAKDETLSDMKKAGILGVVPCPTDTPYQLLYEYTAFGIPQGAKNIEAVPYYLRYVLDKSSYNMDNVYFNAQAKDVVEYTTKQSDKKFFFGENENYNMASELANATADQVKSIINKYEGVIQASVDESNSQIPYLSD